MVGPCLHGDGSPYFPVFRLQLGTCKLISSEPHPSCRWTGRGVCVDSVESGTPEKKWGPPLLSFEAQSSMNQISVLLFHIRSRED
jgi:hypothetical protein